MQINSNLSIETTRKKALEIMQKGMIAYKLANLGWDVSEHYGDGFDLLCIQTQDGAQKIARIELKAIDLQSYLEKTKKLFPIHITQRNCRSYPLNSFYF